MCACAHEQTYAYKNTILTFANGRPRSFVFMYITLYIYFFCPRFLSDVCIVYRYRRIYIFIYIHTHRGMAIGANRAASATFLSVSYNICPAAAPFARRYFTSPTHIFRLKYRPFFFTPIEISSRNKRCRKEMAEKVSVCIRNGRMCVLVYVCVCQTRAKKKTKNVRQ